MNTINSNTLSAAELLETLATEKENTIETDTIKRDICLTILHIILPAALASAAAGNVTMRAAVHRSWPYIKKLLP